MAKYILIVIDPNDARQEQAFDRQALSYLLDNHACKYEVETAEGPDIAHLALLGKAFLADFCKSDIHVVFYDVDKDNATFTAH